jgi:MFS family permease
VFQAVVIVAIVLLGRRIVDPVPADPTSLPDRLGAVLSAVGLVLLVMGIMVTQNSWAAAIALIVTGGLVQAWFFIHIRHREQAGEEPLLSTRLFRNQTANLGMVTQNVQWLVLMGTSFTVSAYLQVVRGYNAIETGVIFTAATIGLLASSLGAERFAKRRAQRTLIVAGFVITIAGIGALLAMAIGEPSPWEYIPGLLLIGFGIGLMLTPSVNIVQSAFPDELQGEISGLSRSVSNLGSSMGTAIAGTILVSGLTSGAYGWAMVALAVIGVVGLGAALRLPSISPKPAPVPRPRLTPREVSG